VFLTDAGRAVRKPVERAWQDADRGLAIMLSALDQVELLEQLSRPAPGICSAAITENDRFSSPACPRTQARSRRRTDIVLTERPDSR
jgi:hypothetical protein